MLNTEKFQHLEKNRRQIYQLLTMEAICEGT